MNIQDLAAKRQWFLDAAVTTTIPLMGLLDKDVFYDDGQLQNMPYHNFTEDEIVPILADLCAEGIIEVIDYEWSNELEDNIIHIRPSHAVSPELIKSLLHIKVSEEENIWEKMSYYRLSTKGGTYWEELAQPNWNDFINDSTGGPIFSFNDAEEIETRGGWERCIEGLNENTIREAIQIPPLRVFPQGEEEWTVLTPWEATYWKTFPQAHRVIYPCSDPMWEDIMNLPDACEVVTVVENELMKMRESERGKVLYQRHWYKSPWHD